MYRGKYFHFFVSHFIKKMSYSICCQEINPNKYHRLTISDLWHHSSYNAIRKFVSVSISSQRAKDLKRWNLKIFKNLHAFSDQQTKSNFGKLFVIACLWICMLYSVQQVSPDELYTLGSAHVWNTCMVFLDHARNVCHSMFFYCNQNLRLIRKWNYCSRSVCCCRIIRQCVRFKVNKSQYLIFFFLNLRNLLKSL